MLSGSHGYPAGRGTAATVGAWPVHADATVAVQAMSCRAGRCPAARGITRSAPMSSPSATPKALIPSPQTSQKTTQSHRLPRRRLSHSSRATVPHT
jgi:hypothetical protein